MDRRIHERHRTDFQVRVTALEDSDVSASGEVIDISQSGLGVYLPLQFMPGTAVRLTINDSVLFGFVAHSTPERSYFRTGIEVVQALIGGSETVAIAQVNVGESHAGGGMARNALVEPEAAQSEHLPKGKVDASGAGQRMLPVLERSDAVIH